VAKFGGFGRLDGQFYQPEDVAVDSTGRVFVVDTALQRVSVFQRND
jgi:hypothetical protein